MYIFKPFNMIFKDWFNNFKNEELYNTAVCFVLTLILYFNNKKTTNKTP